MGRENSKEKKIGVGCSSTWHPKAVIFWERTEEGWYPGIVLGFEHGLPQLTASVPDRPKVQVD